jgi:hypothetical protein
MLIKKTHFYEDSLKLKLFPIILEESKKDGKRTHSEQP